MNSYIHTCMDKQENIVHVVEIKEEWMGGWENCLAPGLRPLVLPGKRCNRCMRNAG